jgi:microcystin-dependent protein
MITQSTLTNQNVAVAAGAIDLYPSNIAPVGWFMCDGTAVSRTTYSQLFSVIGTYYGAGDGSTTFNLPDLKGRMPVGYAVSGGHANVSSIGNNDGLAVSTRRPKHNHTNSVTQSNNLTLPAHTHSSTESAHSHGYTGTTGDSGVAMNPPNDFGNINGVGGGGSTGGMSGMPSTTNSGGGGSSITGSITSTGTIGPAGTNPNDSAAYLILNYIIKY